MEHSIEDTNNRLNDYMNSDPLNTDFNKLTMDAIVAYTR